MKAIIWSLEEAVAKEDWLSEPVFLATGAKQVLHFKDGTCLHLEEPLCPMCEIPLELPSGFCPGCEEKVEL